MIAMQPYIIFTRKNTYTHMSVFVCMCAKGAGSINKASRILHINGTGDHEGR